MQKKMLSLQLQNGLLKKMQSATNQEAEKAQKQAEQEMAELRESFKVENALTPKKPTQKGANMLSALAKSVLADYEQ